MLVIFFRFSLSSHIYYLYTILQAYSNKIINQHTDKQNGYVCWRKFIPLFRLQYY